MRKILNPATVRRTLSPLLDSLGRRVPLVGRAGAMCFAAAAAANVAAFALFIASSSAHFSPFLAPVMFFGLVSTDCAANRSRYENMSWLRHRLPPLLRLDGNVLFAVVAVAACVSVLADANIVESLRWMAAVDLPAVAVALVVEFRTSWLLPRWARGFWL